MHNSSKAWMSGWGVGLLWASVAISLAEIWAGQQLGPAGLGWGLLVILLGHVVGGLIMAGAGCIGTRYRVMSMHSTRLVLGNRGSALPSILNILQLVGWATIMLALSGEAGAQVGARYGGLVARREFWILLIGGGTLAWSLTVGERSAKWLHSIVVVGLLLLSGLMTAVCLDPDHYRLAGPYWKPLSLGAGMRLMDLVIAMPISWAPLAADYARLCRSEKSGFWGTFLGYGLVSSWMYAIGLVVFLATGSDDPAGNVLGVMGRIGLALPALLLIFASTVTSDFPDIYSSACSLVNILPRVKPTHTMWGTGLLTIVLALFFDLSRYEDFLIMIGAVFVPLFTVLLVEFFGFRCRGLGELDFRSGRGLEFRGGYRISGMAAWLGGTAAFFAASRTGFVLGGSLTAILVAGLLYALARRGLEPTAEAAAPGPVPRA